MKTSGNNLTNDDIDFMLHMIENFSKYEITSELSQSQLFEIWAVMIHFSNLRPDEVFTFVFEQYYKERSELFNSNKFTEEGLMEFFRWYQEYFTKTQVDFLETQIKLLTSKNKEISIDYFIGNIVSMRKFKRNK